MASVTRCHGMLWAQGSPSVTAQSGCSPGVMVRVLGDGCHGAEGGCHQVPRCAPSAIAWGSCGPPVSRHAMALCPGGPSVSRLGGFGPLVPQGVPGSLPTHVTVRGGCHDMSPLSRPTRGTSGPGLLPARPGPDPSAPPVPAVLRTERRRMLARSLPPLPPGALPGLASGLDREWGRSVTGPGAAATGQGRAQTNRTEPNRVKRSRTEPREAEPRRP